MWRKYPDRLHSNFIPATMIKITAIALTLSVIACLPSKAQLPPSFVSEPRTDYWKFVETVQASLRYRKNPLMTLNRFTHIEGGQVACIMLDQRMTVDQTYRELNNQIANTEGEERRLLTDWINILVPASVRHLCPRYEAAFNDHMDAIAREFPTIKEAADAARRRFGLPVR